MSSDSTDLDLRSAYSLLATVGAMAGPTTTRHGPACPRLVETVDALGAVQHDRPLSESRLDRARRAWASCVESGGKIAESELLALCWDPEIAMRPDFCQRLNSMRQVRSRAIRGLMASYHETWLKDSAPLASILRSRLSSMDRVRGVVERWVYHVDELVGAGAAARFGAACLTSRLSVSKRLSDFGLTAVSRFARAAATELVESAIEARGDDATFEFLVQRVFPHDNAVLSAAVWGKAFDSLVQDTKRASSDDARQRLIDLALQTRGLPDPRIQTAEWQNVPQRTRDRVMQWLSKDDLRFFFNLIMQGQSDVQGRYPFWLKYAGRALRARLVVGDADVARLATQLEAFRQRGRSYARMKGAGSGNANASAFIMDFGPVTIVEFSRPNSSCFVYKNDDTGGYIDLLHSHFAWSQLKNTKAGAYYPHSSGWENRFRNWLAGYGVRPE